MVVEDIAGIEDASLITFGFVVSDENAGLAGDKSVGLAGELLGGDAKGERRAVIGGDANAVSGIGGFGKQEGVGVVIDGVDSYLFFEGATQ